MPQRFRALLSRRFDGKAGLNFCRERENPHLSSPLRMSVAVVSLDGMGVFYHQDTCAGSRFVPQARADRGKSRWVRGQGTDEQECASTASLRYNHDQALGIPK
jgi:hypothetical protein